MFWFASISPDSWSRRHYALCPGGAVIAANFSSITHKVSEFDAGVIARLAIWKNRFLFEKRVFALLLVGRK